MRGGDFFSALHEKKIFLTLFYINRFFKLFHLSAGGLPQRYEIDGESCVYQVVHGGGGSPVAVEVVVEGEAVLGALVVIADDVEEDLEILFFL